MAAGLLGERQGAHARFFRDAKAAARLQHANIVTIFEFGEHEQTPYVVMEFLRGSNLADRLRQGRRSRSARSSISPSSCAPASRRRTRRRCIHRDVKPRNIWVCDNGTVKVLDFGIATAATASGTVDVFASPSYMSPEQITGKPVDRRTDIYSCGAVLYELFAGHRPFEAPTPAGVLMKIVNESAPPIVSPEVPSTLTAVIAKAMERSPDARFPRAVDLGRELKTIKGAADAAVRCRNGPARSVEASGAGIGAGGAGAAGTTTAAFQSPPRLRQPNRPWTRERRRARIWRSSVEPLVLRGQCPAPDSAALFVIWYLRRPESPAAPASVATPASPTAAAPATVPPAAPPAGDAARGAITASPCNSTPVRQARRS